MKRWCVVAIVALIVSCSKEQAGQSKQGAPSNVPIVVGSKNFSESVLLGEIVAQQLERNGCAVDRKLNLGGTFVCDSAMLSGALDVYPEYSGTALTAILKKPTSLDRAAVDATVREGYKARGLTWGPSLGFNNTFAIIVRKTDASKFQLRTISDLKKVQAQFRPGFGYEFVERPDGWPGLLARYALAFGNSPRTMDLGLTYKALASGEVDVIAGNSTDGIIDSLGLIVLQDDLRYFPPYDAALVTRDLSAKCAGAPAALAALTAKIDDATMRELNRRVEGGGESTASVAASLVKTLSERP